MLTTNRRYRGKAAPLAGVVPALAVAGVGPALAVALTFALTMAVSPLAAEDTAPLGSYGIDPEAVSVSGISSGGFMAVQLHVAFSARYSGVGVVAGGPFFCAEGSATRAIGICMMAWPHAPGADALASVTHAVADAGDIDETSNLDGDPVYIFHGLQDDVVRKPVIESLVRYYGHFVDSDDIEFVDRIDAPHSFVTDNADSQQCHQRCSPMTHHCEPDSCEPDDRCSFVNNCDYDTAEAIFEHVYFRNGSMATAVDPVPANLTAFDQSEFVRNNDPSRYSMADTGHVYVPSACQSGDTQCRLHVAVHGCLQSSDRIGDAFYSGAGYNRWAEANNIIVLYPQVAISDMLPLNPEGCWDFWGYSAVYYYHQDAPQMAAIDAMVDRLMGTQTGD